MKMMSARNTRENCRGDASSGATESMVERVARALFLAEHPGSEWSPGRARSKWWFMAEAAIEAMLEPTDAMCLEGAHASNPGIDDSWRAMIQAALREPT